MNGAVVCLAFASVGKTLSSGSLHAPCASERLRVMPQAESVALSVVTPISRRPAGTGAPGFQLDHNAAVSGQEQLFLRHVRQLHADAAAHRHHRHRRRNAAAADRVRAEHVAAQNRLMQGFIEHQRLVVFRHERVVHRQRQQRQPMSLRALEIGGDDVARVHHAHGEGNKRRRNMNILKRAAHGILAADGGRSEAELGAQAAEQRRRRLAPTELIAIQALEIFLERQPRAGDIAARRADFRQRFGDGVDRAVERAPRAQFRVVAVAHQGGGRRFARRGNRHGHGLVRAVAVHAAVGRKDRARADGAVKPLDKPLLRADVEIGEHRQPRLAHGAILREIRLFRQIRRGLVRRGDFCLGVLGHAVRIQKRAGEIHDRLAAPVHHKARFLGDDGNLRRLQILLAGHLLEALKRLRRDDAGHALLRFGNRQLRAVQPLVFLRHGVQLDSQGRRRKLADGDAHAARAEVVAALNHLRDTSAVAEQPLDACARSARCPSAPPRRRS